MTVLIGSVWRLREGRGLPYRYRVAFVTQSRVALRPINGGREKTIRVATLRKYYEPVKA